MPHRIRITTLCALAAIALAALIPGAAHAGPTPLQPAEQAVSKTDAHRVAEITVTQLIRSMPKPRRYAIGDCRGYGNPKLQQCPVRLASRDTNCTATIWVWRGSRPSGHNYFFSEWHRLRCSG